MPDILVEKNYKEYSRVSRYSSVPYYYNIIDRKYQTGTVFNLKTSTAHRMHKVVEGDTLDSLSLYYYNNPTYFWIIADFNKISDPYIKLKAGTILKIPTFSTIEFEE